MKKHILTLITIVALLPLANAQLTFEDLEFKNRLLNHTPPIDGNQDGEITKAEAEAFDNPHIDVRGYGSGTQLTSVQGIEYFTKVIHFTCESNPGLTSIDVSGMPQLVRLRSHSCGLTSVNITGLSKLTEISIHNNKVTALDLSSAAALITLQVSNNLFASIDVSNSPNLKFLRAGTNALTSLNTKNGNNTKISNFEAAKNPDLTCIEVDDVAYSTTNWTKKDATSEFKISCGGNASVEELELHFSVYPNPTSNSITINTDKYFHTIQVLDITGKTVRTFIQSSRQLNVADLPSGMYTLHILGDNKIGYSKFIKK